jgi:hypothetical protein
MISCVNCSRMLPLIEPDRQRPVSWTCVECGAVYTGRIDTRCSGRGRREVVPVSKDSAIEGVQVGAARCPTLADGEVPTPM